MFNSHRGLYRWLTIHRLLCNSVKKRVSVCQAGKANFFPKNGEVAFEVLFKNDDELFIFPDGSTYTKIQFLKKFIQSLQLTKRDTVIVDRCAMLNFIQPLFESSNQARIVAVLHSEHYFERYQDPSALYLNYELYYLFKYAHKINTFIVSTEEQRRELLKTLQKYGYFIPSVKVIPAGALEMLRYPTAPRRPYSLVTVSRLEKKKKAEWVVRSVIAAHKRNPNISLDVYGTGNIGYIRYLKEIIDQENAQTISTSWGMSMSAICTLNIRYIFPHL